MSYPNPWLYNGEVFDTDKIDKYYGFVYLITNKTTNKKYVGKKFFFSTKRKQVNKKKKRILVESDWKSYYGSNDQLNNDVELYGTDSFERKILHLCSTKGQCSYYEAKEQFAVDCLRSEEYYNTWIQVKVHRKHLKGG